MSSAVAHAQRVRGFGCCFGIARSSVARMAWVKIPKEHHPIFRDALPPGDRRVSVLQMFGGVAAKVNGHMATGLFARSVIVKLGDTDRAAALALDGAAPFDPMGNGRIMADPGMLS